MTSHAKWVISVHTRHWPCAWTLPVEQRIQWERSRGQCKDMVNADKLFYLHVCKLLQWDIFLSSFDSCSTPLVFLHVFQQDTPTDPPHPWCLFTLCTLQIQHVPKIKTANPLPLSRRRVYHPIILLPDLFSPLDCLFCSYFPSALITEQSGFFPHRKAQKPPIVTMVSIGGVLHFHCKTWRLMQRNHTTLGEIAVNTLQKLQTQIRVCSQRRFQKACALIQAQREIIWIYSDIERVYASYWCQLCMLIATLVLLLV